MAERANVTRAPSHASMDQFNVADGELLVGGHILQGQNLQPMRAHGLLQGRQQVAPCGRRQQQAGPFGAWPGWHNGRVWRRGGCGHCAVAPDSLTTVRHFSNSFCTN